MTLNGVKRPLLCVISLNSVAFRVHYVRIVENTCRPIQSATMCGAKNVVLAIYHNLWRYSRRLLRTSARYRYLHFAIHCEDRVQNIKIPFAQYGI